MRLAFVFAVILFAACDKAPTAPTTLPTSTAPRESASPVRVSAQTPDAPLPDWPLTVHGRPVSDDRDQTIRFLCLTAPRDYLAPNGTLATLRDAYLADTPCPPTPID